MKNILPLLVLILLFSSCSQERKQKLSYEKQEVEDSEISVSGISGKAFLPVQMDSTAYLIHPIGKFNINNVESYTDFGGSGPGSGAYSQSGYFGSDTYNGNLNIIKFLHVSSDSLIALTEANLRIISFSFLREIFEKTGKKYLVYQIYDNDTNQDKKIDAADINTLL